MRLVREQRPYHHVALAVLVSTLACSALRIGNAYADIASPLLKSAPRNCPVLMMEAMNGECQEAIIEAFMHMHKNEIELTKEQASKSRPPSDT